ncbi:MAG: type II toxin-antitoxin system Phd/YefM family antitoxin [Thermus caldifontis]|uniref:type II toxin-antitoxin system Phd/YefM family antitoxin n=1 Tax=Thermus caldifontis TaxID=1930763 RepID=UPI000DF462C8|nr:type II toxin-antitoxin system Phd/YefM family antitoxin [Thermus caldifontis]
MRVSKSYFKAHALELLRQVQTTGEPLILTDRGRPVLVVQPYREEDHLDRLKGTLVLYQDPLEPTGEAWEALG